LVGIYGLGFVQWISPSITFIDRGDIHWSLPTMHRRMLVTLLTTLAAANVVLSAEDVNDHWSGMSKRQDGPTVPDTASDCWFWDTMLDKSMHCKYFEDVWGLTHEQFLDYASNA
jgi:hypothetical protein